MIQDTNSAVNPLSEARAQPYGIVYRATNKVNEKVYIGQTTYTLEQRQQSHMHDVRRKRNYHFGNALIKYGLDGFAWEEIDAGFSALELNDMERYWIQFYDSTNDFRGYNLKAGGDNHRHHQKTKQKITASLKRLYAIESHPMLGRKMSQKTKDKISDMYRARIGQPGYRHPNLGKAMSTDLIDKIKMTHSLRHGKVRLPYIAKKPLKRNAIQCVETGKTYLSFSQAALELNISGTNFVAYFKGKRHSIRGMQWKKL